MTAYVALLRGINVGGNNPLPMAALRQLLADVGCTAVATYIQSGNAVFCHEGDADKLRGTIADAIEKAFGFRPSVVVIVAAEFLQIAGDNPYAEVAADAKHLHVLFAESRIDRPDIRAIREIAAPDESFTLSKFAFYLHAPSGIGRSKLVSKVEKLLGVAATGRNWRTVLKLESMLADIR